MNLFPTTLLFFSSVTTILLARAQDFTPIPGTISTEINGVLLPACCGSVHGRSVPTPMYTIEPALASIDTVTILTSPADLVTASVEGKLLNLTFNPAVATRVNESGIKLQIPNSQFQELAAQSSAQVQVLPGFSFLKSIRAASSSLVRVVVASASTLNVSVSSSATLDLQLEGGVVEQARVSSSGSLHAKAATIKDVHVWFSGTAVLTVDHPIEAGSVTSCGTLTTSAKGSCQNVLVQPSGNCEEEEDINVTVRVGEPYIMAGTIGCNMLGGTDAYLEQ